MTTLVLSGWTQPPEALNEIAPGATLFDYSRFPTPEKSYTAIAAYREKAQRVIAWSLGGQLALRAVAVGALAPQHLTLIAVPYRFVGEDGMGEETFRLFRESYAKDPARTKARFHSLVAKGDVDFKRVATSLGHHDDVDNIERWLPWLDALGRYDIRAMPLAHAPRTLIIHGINDAIVPHGQATALARLLPRATVEDWADVGHAPHVHDAARMRDAIARHRHAQ
jgi:pimeloyl-ACP methyl ester carboxylesterase